MHNQNKKRVAYIDNPFSIHFVNLVIRVGFKPTTFRTGI